MRIEQRYGYLIKALQDYPAHGKQSLSNLQRMRVTAIEQAIETAKEETEAEQWEAIQELYVSRRKNIHGVASALCVSKSSAYRIVLHPFFERLEELAVERLLALKE